MNTTVLPKPVLDALTDLADMHAESWRGLAEAAEGLKQEQTSEMLRQIGRSRLAAAEELKKILAENGRTAAQTSSAAAVLHRVWIDLKSKLTDGKPWFVLSEVERGDEHLTRKYQEAIALTAGTAVEDLIRKQSEQVLRETESIRQHRSRFVS